MTTTQTTDSASAAAPIPPVAITGTFAGVDLGPVTLYDCRLPAGEPTPKAHYGESLYAGERAAYALGLRLSWHEQYDATPMSVSVYYDTRRPENAADTAALVAKLVTLFGQCRTDYRRALRDPGMPNGGGTIYYQPIAIALANYGGSVLADTRQIAVTA